MNPLFVRHLYESARKNRFFWLLSAYLLAVSVITLLFVGLIGSSTLYNGQTHISMSDLYTEGRALYWTSGVLLIVAAVIIAPTSALGMFSGERENRTLDLLRTTTLRPRDIVWGKLGACLLRGAVYILAPLPLLMLGYWIGGVTLTELGLLTLILGMAALENIALALYLSAHIRRTIAAVLTFFGINFGLVPIIGILTGLLVSLSQYRLYGMTLKTVSPFWVEALLQYGWFLIVCLHPLSAAIATQALWMDQNSWFLVKFTLDSRISYKTLGVLTLPSPWIIYTLATLLFSALLIHSTIRRLSRPEK